jgi:hypothetical protein
VGTVREKEVEQYSVEIGKRHEHWIRVCGSRRVHNGFNRAHERVATALNIDFQVWRRVCWMPKTKALWERSQDAVKVARPVLKQRRGR